MPMWCVAPLEMNEGNSLGQGYNRPTGCSAEKAPHATFNFFFTESVIVTKASLRSEQSLLQNACVKSASTLTQLSSLETKILPNRPAVSNLGSLDSFQGVQ